MQTIEYEWVIGAYNGDQAKHVKGQADAGIGYYFQRESGRGASYSVHVAFRRAIDGPLADHLELATAGQIEKLEKLWDRRHGVVERAVSGFPANLSDLFHPGIQQGMDMAIPENDR